MQNKTNSVTEVCGYAVLVCFQPEVGEKSRDSNHCVLDLSRKSRYNESVATKDFAYEAERNKYELKNK